MSTRFVYGPVPSRRLGRSLGVDLVPFKTCSYDCIYCQLGRTTDKTTKLREYVPVDNVLGELAEKLRAGTRPDFIGLAGSGEPTLHSRIGDIVEGIKALTNVPVAVLTNGSLLWKPEVRAGLAEADLVMPSLDAGTPASFERVNRPHPDIPFDRMVEGLWAFSRGFKGMTWLEVFLLAGITDGPDEIARIAAAVAKMQPHRLQLNTVARPPSEACAAAVPSETLGRLCKFFNSACEVIAESGTASTIGRDTNRDMDNEIEALLNRRPCTVAGIAAGLELAPNEVLKRLQALCATGRVCARRVGDAVFYEPARDR